MTPQKSHLQSDGSVFPPVTPDPPLVPGAVVVDFPDLETPAEPEPEPEPEPAAEPEASESPAPDAEPTPEPPG